MDTDFFNAVGNMLATGPITLADIILVLVAWTTVGLLALAMGSYMTHVPVPPKQAVNHSVSRKKALKTAA